MLKIIMRGLYQSLTGILLITLFFTNTVFAQVNNSPAYYLKGINEEKINPNLLVYPAKRFYEKVFLIFLRNNDKKADYHYNLLQKRLNELVYIVNNDKTGFYEEVVGRYNAEIITVRKNCGNRSAVIKNNIQILEKLRDKYHSNSTYWMTIQHAIDITNDPNS